MSDLRLLAASAAALTIALLSGPAPAESASDPTRPPVLPLDPERAEEEANRPSLDLQAIFFAEGRRVAIINDQRVTKDDVVLAATVVEIQRDRVALSRNEETIELVLVGANVKSPADDGEPAPAPQRSFTESRIDGLIDDFSDIADIEVVVADETSTEDPEQTARIATEALPIPADGAEFSAELESTEEPLAAAKADSADGSQPPLASNEARADAESPSAASTETIATGLADAIAPVVADAIATGVADAIATGVADAIATGLADAFAPKQDEKAPTLMSDASAIEEADGAQAVPPDDGDGQHEVDASHSETEGLRDVSDESDPTPSAASPEPAGAAVETASTDAEATADAPDESAGAGTPPEVEEETLASETGNVESGADEIESSEVPNDGSAPSEAASGSSTVVAEAPSARDSSERPATWSDMPSVSPPDWSAPLPVFDPPAAPTPMSEGTEE